MSVTGLSFASTYWHRNAGLDFTQKTLADPQAQMEQRRLRSEHLYEFYRSLGLPAEEKKWSSHPDNQPVVGGYGVATIAMLFGCQGVFTEEFDPYAKPLELTDEEILNLRPQADFSDNPVMRDLEEQAAWLVRRYGKARIAINMQSVPNIAFKLRGDQLMYDFYENPEIVHKLADYLQQSSILLRDYICGVNERNHSPDAGDNISLDNCTVALISPQIYRDFFLLYDKKTAEHYSTRFGVHHCGGNMHLFSRDYSTLGRGVWYDIGYGSDVDACMAHLYDQGKKPFWSVRYGPAKLRSAEPGEIRQEVRRLKISGADSISCVGVDPDTPLENIRVFLAEE